MGVLHAMTISKLKVLCTAALAFACLLGGVRVLAISGPQDQPAAANPQTAPAPGIGLRYEYQSVRLVYESNLADRATEESAKGWELHLVVPVVQGVAGNINTQYTMLFRRPVEAKK
jgi:hypothetical protein